MSNNRADENDFLQSVHGLTHSLKGTVGLIRAVAASDLVQPKARMLLEQVAERIQDSYQALESMDKVKQTTPFSSGAR
jgi:hypothetical protein